MRIFTRVNGEILVWTWDGSDDPADGIAAVQAELGPGHTTAVLALVKF